MNASQIVKKADGAAIAADQKNRILSWNRGAKELFELRAGDCPATGTGASKTTRTTAASAVSETSNRWLIRPSLKPSS